MHPLRGLHDPNLTYSGSFIVHWLEKIVYPGLDLGQFRVAAAVWVGLNLIGYGVLLRKRKRKRRN